MKQTRASVKHFEESLFLFFCSYCAFDKFNAFSFKISYVSVQNVHFDCKGKIERGDAGGVTFMSYGEDEEREQMKR